MREPPHSGTDSERERHDCRVTAGGRRGRTQLSRPLFRLRGGRASRGAKWTLIFWNADEVSIRFRPAVGRKAVLAAFLAVQ